MFKFSSIPNNTILGRLMRFPLRVIPQRLILPILQGPLRGKKWIKGSGVNGYWLGTYEIENQKEIIKNIKEGFKIMDIGAHVGFYSLIFSNIVGAKGMVVSFEPSLRNLGFLRRHIEMNKIDNVKVFDLALSDSSGKGFLVEGSNSFTNHLGESGKEIWVSTIDEWCEENNFKPDLIKIDVEGFELNALKGGEGIIKKYLPIIAVAYNIGQHDEYISFFKNLNYETEFIKNHTGHIDMVIAKKK